MMYERMALIWFSCFCCASENLSLHSRRGERSLDVLRVRGPPAAFRADLGEADDDIARSFRGARRCGVRGSGTAGEGQEKGADGDRSDHLPDHVTKPPCLASRRNILLRDSVPGDQVVLADAEMLALTSMG
ncbi:hypothetical protein [Cryobacterium breve]|uniref:hypothetical protein n=1 Tax=Cryobacterium breve TaxID=1259258 RepID=UPI0032B28844